MSKDKIKLLDSRGYSGVSVDIILFSSLSN